MGYGPGASAQLWQKLGWKDVHFMEVDRSCAENWKEKIAKEGYQVHIGDQQESAALEEVKANLDFEVEVVVDDGGHWNKQILTSFYTLWPIVRNGGFYFVEDWAEVAYYTGYYDAPKNGVGRVGDEKPGTFQWEIGMMLRHLFCKPLKTPCYGNFAFIETQFSHVLFRKGGEEMEV
ncbi:unnamed protein product [Amoebophrya sp. A120]|nr:unnamed protein product [Amoebophrya sp. A120]|eukprot:GSA120T00015123001.1